MKPPPRTSAVFRCNHGRPNDGSYGFSGTGPLASAAVRDSCAHARDCFGGDSGTCRGVAERFQSVLAKYGRGLKGMQTDVLIPAQLLREGTVGAIALPHFLDQLASRLDGDGLPDHGNKPLLARNRDYVVMMDRYAKVGFAAHCRRVTSSTGDRVPGHPGKVTTTPVPGENMAGHSFKFEQRAVDCALDPWLVANVGWEQERNLQLGEYRDDAAGRIANYPCQIRTVRKVRTDSGAGCCVVHTEDPVVEVLTVTLTVAMCELFYEAYPAARAEQVPRLDDGDTGATALRQSDWQRELHRLRYVHPQFTGWAAALDGLDATTLKFPSTTSFTGGWPVGLTGDRIATAADAKKRVKWKDSDKAWPTETREDGRTLVWPEARKLSAWEQAELTLRTDYFAGTVGGVHKRPAAAAAAAGTEHAAGPAKRSCRVLKPSVMLEDQPGLTDHLLRRAGKEKAAAEAKTAEDATAAAKEKKKEARKRRRVEKQAAQTEAERTCSVEV